MSQLDNLDVTIRRLIDEGRWSIHKVKRFGKWLSEKDIIQKGQRPGSKFVRNLFKEIKKFEEILAEEKE